MKKTIPLLVSQDYLAAKEIAYTDVDIEDVAEQGQFLRQISLNL